MKPTLYQQHPDLFRLASWAAMAILGIAALVIIIWYGTRTTTKDTYYDKISDQTYSTEKTGASTSGISITSGNLLEEMDSTKLLQINAIIERYTEVMYPNITGYSVKSNSVEQKDDIFTYQIISNTDQRFTVKASNNSEGYIQFTLSDENNEILNYDSRLIRTSSIHISRLAKDYLPKTIIKDDLVFSITQNRDESYQININSCGDQQIKDRA